MKHILCRGPSRAWPGLSQLVAVLMEEFVETGARYAGQFVQGDAVTFFKVRRARCAAAWT